MTFTITFFFGHVFVDTKHFGDIFIIHCIANNGHYWSENNSNGQYENYKFHNIKLQAKVLICHDKNQYLENK